MEGDGRERVEEVRVDGPSLGHVVVLLLLRSFLLSLGVGPVGTVVETRSSRVDHGVDTPAHAAKGAHSVCSRHINFLTY